MKSVTAHLDRLGKELDELKRSVQQQTAPKVKVSLKGVLKSAKIAPRDVEQAKRSLFPAANSK
jgi:hypothetical protein